MKRPATIDSSLRDGRNRDGPKPADIHISPQLLIDILASRRLLTPEHCLKLSRYFGNEPEYWMRLQNHYLFHTTDAEKAAELASIHHSRKLSERHRSRNLEIQEPSQVTDPVVAWRA